MSSRASLLGLGSSSGLALLLLASSQPGLAQVNPPAPTLLDTQKIANFSQYIDADFVLFWPYPNRAYLLGPA